MQQLHLESSRTTPEVNFDLVSGVFELSGMSICENAPVFYAPLLEAIQEYSKKALPVTILNIRLTYFNTSSSKMILKLLSAFAAMDKRITKVNINWYYNVNDEDMVETANDMEDIVKLEFKYIGIEEKT